MAGERVAQLLDDARVVAPGSAAFAEPIERERCVARVNARIRPHERRDVCAPNQPLELIHISHALASNCKRSYSRYTERRKGNRHGARARVHLKHRVGERLGEQPRCRQTRRAERVSIRCNNSV